jgi:ATP-dependent Clp protease ATP-binding subunit ClpA
MTTNLGSKEFDDMQRKNPLGFNTKDVCSMDDEEDAQALIKTIKRTASEALRDYMKPELIGRITDVVPFMNLNESGLKDVAELEWDKARVYLTEKLPEIHITEELKEHIASSAANKKLGARPVQRMIEQYAVDAVAEIYVEYPEKVENTEQIIIDIADNNGSCDTVNVILGESEYEYEVKQTLSDD